MKIQDALDLHLKEEASRIIGESMAQRAILFRSSEKEKQRFTRSGNLYVALYAWYA